MKRSYLSLALAGMLFATACSEEQITSEIGGESVVTFTAELPSQVSSSRAYGEGTTATTLHYAIYEVGQTTPLIVCDDENPVTFTNLKAKFEVSLVNGMTYDVVFWADAPGSIYSFDAATQTITANYSAATSNQESYDAFYQVVKDMQVNGAAQQPVELYRPFAQLNIGTNDTDQAATAGIEVDATQVEVKAYTTLNLYTGEVSGETTITYAKSAKAEGTFPIADNEYLAMNYILVPADYTTYDVTFTTYEGTTQINERTYTAVPLQRNYKTNIYGRLLTSTTEFNVEIKPAFNKTEDGGDLEVEDVVTNKSGIKAILDAAVAAGETNIIIHAMGENIGDMNYCFTKANVPAGTTVTICDAVVEGTSYGNATNGNVIFKNCTFKNSGAYSIHFDAGNGNVTFEDCTLYGWNSFGAALNSVSFYNCKLYGNGTYALIRSYADLTLEDCLFDITNAKHTDNYSEGAEVIGDATMTMTNCVWGASDAATLTKLISEATEDITIVLGADITGNVTAPQKENVKITILGEGHTFNGVLTVDGKSATYTTAGLTIKDVKFVAESISADACIRLGDGTNATRYTCNVTVENCTFDVPGAVGIKSYTGGDKNLTISGCTATDKAHSLVQAKGIDGILVENCTVNSKNGMNFNNSNNVFVDACTANVKGYAVRFGESSGGTGAAEEYTITNSTLVSECNDGDAVIILRGTADNATLNINNTTIEGTTKIANNATGAKVYIDGGIYTTTLDFTNNNITLADGSYTLPAASNKDLAISGTKDVIITINKPNYSGSDVTFNGVTVKGSGYSTGIQHVNNVTYNDVTIIGEMCLYGEKVIFNNCSFELNNQYIWTYGAKEVEFNNCTFNTNGKAILIYNEGAGANNVTVKNCTFNATAGAKAGAIANQNCAAIEIDNFQSSGVGAAHVLTTEGNTWNDNFSGQWRIKNFVNGNSITVDGQAYSTIAIDGKTMTIDSNKNVTVS